jgi:hypothetical protein
LVRIRLQFSAFHFVDSARINLGDVNLAVDGDGGENFFDGGADFACGFLTFTEGEHGRTCTGNGEAEGA